MIWKLELKLSYRFGTFYKCRRSVVGISFTSKFNRLSANVNLTSGLFVSRVNIPDIYKSTYSDICRADATAIDLGKLNKYFYELGRYVAAFDRNGFVGKMIYEVRICSRFYRK